MKMDSGSMISHSSPEIVVVIATSMCRTNLLLERSLCSVYNQTGVDKFSISLVVVDDNVPLPNGLSGEFYRIQEGIKKLRDHLSLSPDEFQTFVLANNRTRGNSGTGAWNTGIYFAFEQNPESYVSILDDDDEYLPNHLNDCIQEIRKSSHLQAVFQRMYWLHEDGTKMELPLKKKQLIPEAFFIGNPGVQGSNMFFKSSVLVEIGAFNERYPNTTDREIMIRFLKYIEVNELNNSITVIETEGVIHYNHKTEKVNNNLERKQKGLELFYREHQKDFSEAAYQASLERAKRFFSYQPTTVL